MLYCLNQAYGQSNIAYFSGSSYIVGDQLNPNNTFGVTFKTCYPTQTLAYQPGQGSSNISIQLIGGVAVLQWTTTGGATYRVQGGLNLHDSNWNSIQFTPSNGDLTYAGNFSVVAQFGTGNNSLLVNSSLNSIQPIGQALFGGTIRENAIATDYNGCMNESLFTNTQNSSNIVWQCSPGCTPNVTNGKTFYIQSIEFKYSMDAIIFFNVS